MSKDTKRLSKKKQGDVTLRFFEVVVPIGDTPDWTVDEVFWVRSSTIRAVEKAYPDAFYVNELRFGRFLPDPDCVDVVLS